MFACEKKKKKGNENVLSRKREKKEKKIEGRYRLGEKSVNTVNIGIELVVWCIIDL